MSRVISEYWGWMVTNGAQPWWRCSPVALATCQPVKFEIPR